MNTLRRTSNYMIHNFHRLFNSLRKSHSNTKYDNSTSNVYTENVYTIKHSITGTDYIIIPIHKNILLSSHTIKLSPESLLFIAHLNGHNKNLFLFLLLFHVNSKTLEINWDELVIQEYIEYCDALELEKPTSKQIKETIKELAKRKVITNIKRGRYMLNPIIIGGMNEYNRNEMLKKYSGFAIAKNKAVDDELFPVIYNFKNKIPH
jgi:hypothetical protein